MKGTTTVLSSPARTHYVQRVDLKVPHVVRFDFLAEAAALIVPRLYSHLIIVQKLSLPYAKTDCERKENNN